MKIHVLKEKMGGCVSRLKEEISGIRTGRATSSLVENIKVEAYEGSPPLAVRELATISVSEPTNITISPWDLSLIPKIERAVRSSPGGLNPVVFDDLIRVPVPPLSGQRRQELTKVVRKRCEETKVEIRQIRQDEMKSIDEMEQNGIISEDEKFRLRDEVENIVKQKTAEIEKIAGEKEAELLKI